MTKPDTARIEIGWDIGGKYRVEKVLGCGGMGVVVAARHLELDQLWAIKLMHRELVHDSALVERFVREARAATRIKSEHVARVVDVGRLETGAPYIVMEHLDGLDLGRLLRVGKPIAITQAVTWLLQACDAVGEAHALGIIHRDLKPANLFLARDGNGAARVKVIDFGISKMTTPSVAELSELTRPNEVIGSPSYMAPEQIRALRSASPRTDVWSLGVILYELVTGRRPFVAEGEVGTIAMVLEGTPAPPSAVRPDLPRGLEEIILRCLEKDPVRRVGSVAALVDALRPYAYERATDAEHVRAQTSAATSPIVDSTVLLATVPLSEAQRRGLNTSGATRFEAASQAPRASRSHWSAVGVGGALALSVVVGLTHRRFVAPTQGSPVIAAATVVEPGASSSLPPPPPAVSASSGASAVAPQRAEPRPSASAPLARPAKPLRHGPSQPLLYGAWNSPYDDPSVLAPPKAGNEPDAGAPAPAPPKTEDAPGPSERPNQDPFGRSQK